ncbi:MAG TPA: Re/Si-specific NAD(P)(+) transhydrogenase subunit alpha [Nitrososphaerales archaeon]|nr:Re/Si-specific NAD(P)(+) transhydrogenase subunit alpha [Nitrososphaerales archaeon]
MIIGVPKETVEGEKRVSLVPESVLKLKGVPVHVQSGAGEGAGITDPDYTAAGATIEKDADSLFAASDLVVKVQPPTPQEAALMKKGSAVVSFLYPLAHLETIRGLVQNEATAFAMELMPRISRAQSMDALSSQSLVSGYKSVLIAAESLPKLFPMLMTAAGTIAPARVFVLGAGVAGLEAIATARRLGAVVEAYDVRPAVKEQIESLGAKFVELPLEAKDAQTSGGYAKAQSDEFYRKQQELLASHSGASDVVITTALVPGSKAPILVTEDAVKRMRPGSVVVDLAAEQGGNCALAEPGKTVVKYGVVIHAPLNLPSSMAPQASQLYSRNVTTFIQPMIKEGALSIDPNDDLVKGTMVLQAGKVLHGPTKTALEGTSR